MMVSRRGGRPVWLPALLTWFPLLVVGAWLMVGIDFDSREVRPDEHSVRITVPEPSQWIFQDAWGILGLALVIGGLVMVGLYIWSPDPMRWRLVVAEFPAFRSAAWVFTFLGLLSLWDLHSHLQEMGETGLQWRFIASLRAGFWNRAIAILFLTAALACTVTAYGGTWRIMAWPMRPGMSTRRPEFEAD